MDKVFQKLKKIPLGIPLMVTSVGTVAAIFAGKKVHSVFGAAWTLLSALHAWQHMNGLKGFKSPAKNSVGDSTVPEQFEPYKNLLAGITVSSYHAGRIRIYSPLLRDEESAEKAELMLRSVPGITKTAANTMTGSLLINYDPEIIKNNGTLRAAESYAEKRAKIKL